MGATVFRERPVRCVQVVRCEAETTKVTRLVHAMRMIRIEQVANKFGVLYQGPFRVGQLHLALDNHGMMVLEDENATTIACSCAT